VRSTAAGGDQIVICTGMAQAIALVLRVLATDGIDTLAVEDPGAWRFTAEQAAANGVALTPIAVDRDGLDVTLLERTEARAVLVTPAHQWPTGVVLAGHRRQQLIAWARERDAIIIEDDYDAEFRYDRDPVGAMQGLAPDAVISLGTVSKSLAPTLRLGWLLAPDRLLDRLALAKQVADRGSPGLDQLALAKMLESGRYDRHLRRMRTEYAKRREVLVAALALHAPGVAITGLAAGFHAVVTLPADAQENRIIEKAARRGVGLYGMSSMRHSAGPHQSQLILGFGDTSQSAIQAGIAAVGDLLCGTPE
jgi:GntR family transcriptional regulator/MocR family aminotransferase